MILYYTILYYNISYHIISYHIILYYICIQSEHLVNESFEGFAMLRPGPQCAVQGVDVSLQSLESAWIANGVLRDNS